ncbi:hypothetical protein CEXT_96141 [Caerostris extrusa]|uniref:Secreted protein n=1 Tax=Caerostris extrusa TaxID=172846 RepID=A0AAV4W3M2_CAEEX|nr:hypothetical protein CEXT_96141 [Caerostris extrusa]
MFMGGVSVAFYGRRLLEFFLLSAPEPWTKTRTDQTEGWMGVEEKGWSGTGFLHYRSEWFSLWHNSGTYNFSISLLRHAV